MDWVDTGYILSTQKHGETSAIIDVFTQDHGRHKGLVRGGISRKMRPVLQPGNYVNVEWRGRLSEQLGYYVVEAIDSRAAELMDDRLSLTGLNAMTAMCREMLPERERHFDIYNVFQIVLSNLHEVSIWPALYIRWEAGLLSALGYGLDFTRCAATGRNDNLTHISPRSGRAVSASAAEPYLDKLLRLPPFMRGENTSTPEDILDGLKLTGYFLETRVQWELNRTLPEARQQLVERLMAAEIAVQRVG
ncbi:DNA replication and repair protein RecO [Litorimonas taeanensis]|uniref:DNA repair protein RecO n=1 Tax=Litorimonas taeanensis TaxID=568099 RepID=A0A420WKB2_9PROT|nr:DNA repair protein RecO [Litorimonas taeanensis]RKQ71447.1 DNA replication and repair protein RecO [Litorimonas taeanensis]